MNAVSRIARDPVDFTAPNLARRFYLRHSGAFDVVMPNVFIDHWGECDLLGINKSGYAVEIEIKISRADFYQDAKKTVNWRYSEIVKPSGYRYSGMMPENKHTLLAGSECFPNRFFFLTPEGLVTADEVPDWAGLYEMSDMGIVRKQKDAPLLHKTKPAPEFLAKQYKKFVYRHWQQPRFKYD